MSNCSMCIKEKFGFFKSNFLEIMSFFISLGSFLLTIFLVYNFFIDHLASDENVAILTASGVFAGIFASICYSQHIHRKKQESLLKALSLLLFQFFRTSESYKDAYLWNQKNTFQNLPLDRYTNKLSKTETQAQMTSDKTLNLDIATTIIQKNPTNAGFPFYPLGEFNFEIYFTSINENINGISTTHLKASLLDIKSKIDLCNRYVLDSSITNRFGRLLNALVDLDKYIQKSIAELHKFKFIKNFEDLKKTQGYSTLKIRCFN